MEELIGASLGALGAVLGALVGAGLAFIIAGRRLRVESSQWQMDAIVRGMGFLTGGRQERSAGIGIIEALITSGSVPDRVRAGVDNVLWNQLVYVVYHGDLKQRHEQVNAQRLLGLIHQSPDRSQIAGYAPGTLDELEKRVRSAVEAATSAA